MLGFKSPHICTDLDSSQVPTTTLGLPMLLRSTSSPILKSWIAAAKEPSPPEHAAAELPSQIRRARSVAHLSPTISLSSTPSSSPSPRRMISRALSDSNLSDPAAAPKPKSFSSHGLPSISLHEEKWGGEGEEEGEATDSISQSLGHLLSNSGLDAPLAVAEGKSGARAATLVMGGGCARGGGRICGGGGEAGGGDGNDGFGCSDSNSSNDDAHYLKMIKANPGNSLVLGNYARFLKDVRGDLGRAQEYCERAILANPGDADVLSLYGDLIWATSGDAQRAEGYFDRSVQAAPQDCYVMASYARFLWDAEEEEEEEEEDDGLKESYRSRPIIMSDSTPSIAAAS